MFDLPRTDNGLADVQLEFALLDWDRVTKNEVMGIESFMFYFANFPKFVTKTRMYIFLDYTIDIHTSKKFSL